MGDFPCIPPIVSFTGLIVGTGHSSLRRDLLPGPGAAQLNCCGFVRLSTYVAPGMPNKVPFKGFHPFQVFVIFLFALTLGHLVQGRRRRHHDGTASLYATEATSFLRFRGLPGLLHPWLRLRPRPATLRRPGNDIALSLPIRRRSDRVCCIRPR
ncbi:hypothetical protein HRG_012187 [Hirsutella rhossiliensis]